MKPAELVHYRDQFGLTQRELAHVLGVHQSAVSRWEDGLRPIPGWLERFLVLYAEKTGRGATA